MANYFTNENPQSVINNTGNYGILPAGIATTQIVDGLTDRGAGLGKLGSSMPSPLARLFLFSAALREVNSYESKNPGQGHKGVTDKKTNDIEPTPYHDLVGELLDMLEFVFQYGDAPEFHVVTWDVNADCKILNASSTSGHKLLASALSSAFDFGVLKNQPIHIFLWKDNVIGGTSPISLVYTSANLRSVLGRTSQKFMGEAGNILFADEAKPLHERSATFRDYLYRLRLTDMQVLSADVPLYQLSKYIQDSATNYDANLNNRIIVDPSAFSNVKFLTSQGANVKVGAVQLRVSDHTVVIDPKTSDYIIKPTTDVYKHGDGNVQIPMVLTKYGVDGLKYAANRFWSTTSDIIPQNLPQDINSRDLPGFVDAKYPYLTVDDFFEEKVIEVSYKINREKFFTGCTKDISFLLPLKRVFFEYFTLHDLVDNGKYTDMLNMKYDDQRKTLTIELKVPLVNGHSIVLHKKYNVGDDSEQRVDCYEAGNTFDLAFFPFYRLEPNKEKNVYNIMIGASAKGVSMKFYEPINAGSNGEISNELKHRTLKQGDTPISTDHIRVNDAFTFCELSIGNTKAIVIPLFTIVNSNTAPRKLTFSIDFGTTNTHVAYVESQPGSPFGVQQIQPFSYSDDDAQMVTLNKGSLVEFTYFKTVVNRELVPAELGNNTKISNGEGPIKFPLRTATYQVADSPSVLQMFFNSNIGFNYAEDIYKSGDYKTNIKWDRFDVLAKDRMSTFFAQMLWMMKNKSVLNGGSDKFDLVVTYPISMRRSDQTNFQTAWDNAKREVRCDVSIYYRTESVAPYYSYLSDLDYGEPYVNMDIGGGTTDILYVNPVNHDDHVFSAFFAANDLWNDGIDQANRANKNNGFVMHYKNTLFPNLGNGEKAKVQGVLDKALSSADIVSYLFLNDSETRFSANISPAMMQLLIIHFAALTFYMAYSIDRADVDVPTNLSFTGMGSKYIEIISTDMEDIADIVNRVFYYVGRKLSNEKLQRPSVKVSFAKNPKEITAIGALISLNHRKSLTPNMDTFFGYEDEDPGKTLTYQDIDQNVLDSVMKLFMKFTELFEDLEFLKVLSKIGYSIDPNVIAKLRSYAQSSLQGMKEISFDRQYPTDIFNEPMFFWPLKNSLYVIGKDLAYNRIKGASIHNG